MWCSILRASEFVYNNRLYGRERHNSKVEAVIVVGPKNKRVRRLRKREKESAGEVA